MTARICEVEGVDIYFDDDKGKDGIVLVDPIQLCEKSVATISYVLEWIIRCEAEIRKAFFVRDMGFAVIGGVDEEMLQEATDGRFVVSIVATQSEEFKRETDERDREREEKRKAWLETPEGKASSRRKEFDQIRHRVFPQLVKRDGYECKHCGSDEYLCVDHIIPIVRGGGDNLENLQLLCRSCNSRKGSR